MIAPGITELVERLEKATGPDRELDLDLWTAFVADPAAPSVTKSLGFVSPPAYTASVDAALALIERVLPGWGWEVVRYPYGRFAARLWPGASRPNLLIVEDGATPALALCLALLRALPTIEGEER